MQPPAVSPLPGESPEYRAARDELLRAEIALRRQIEAVAAQRRGLPAGGPLPQDYEFTEWDDDACTARPVRLSQLFSDGTDTLFIYSFMFNPGPSGDPLQIACPMCTSMLDGLDGELPHITGRISVAIASKAPIERFHTHAHARGWRHARLVSTAGTSYNRDYLAETADAAQRPMATVFIRREETIRHFWSSELLAVDAEPGQDSRHVDFMWPLWAVLDRTPEGRGDWRPSLHYAD